MNADLRHLISDAPRVMVADGSKLVRKLIGDVLKKELPNVEVVGCAGLAEAQAALDGGPFHLVTTALALPDGDGLALAKAVRAAAGQAYVPVIVVTRSTGFSASAARALARPSQATTSALGNSRASTSPINLRTSLEPSTTITRGASATTWRRSWLSTLRSRPAGSGAGSVR